MTSIRIPSNLSIRRRFLNPRADNSEFIFIGADGVLRIEFDRDPSTFTYFQPDSVEYQHKELSGRIEISRRDIDFFICDENGGRVHSKAAAIRKEFISINGAHIIWVPQDAMMGFVNVLNLFRCNTL